VPATTVGNPGRVTRGLTNAGVTNNAYVTLSILLRIRTASRQKLTSIRLGEKLMANSLPWGKRAPLLLALPVFVLPLLLGSQRSSVPPSQLQAHQRQPQFQDWSTRHTFYSRYGTMAALEAAHRDPRALSQWRHMEQRKQLVHFPARQEQLHSLLLFRFPGTGRGRFPARGASDLQSDWNISLGAGATSAGQFPAKFSFDTSVAPSCTGDFVVFPVNVDGTATQPNLVAFRNLYTGTAGGNGICNRAVSGTDAGTSAPTVYWAYNVQAIAAGTIPTSPVLSLTGTKVAFVESAAGNAAVFHVLAWKALDGTGANAQSITSPVQITTFSGSAPAAGAATKLALGTATDTLSSPYVDYAADTAYVGNDAGVLFRIKNVFCTNPSCGTAAPSLDTTWGTGGTGSVSVCSGKLTGPVQDVTTNNVYVGCADGKVYGFNSAGVPLATPSLAVGNGSTTGGVVESPIVDGSGFIYAVSGTGAAPNTASAVLVQAKVDLSSPRIALVGLGGFRNLHAPAFNDAFFSSATSSTWLIYTAAFDATAANLTLYGSTFDASRNMTAGTPANIRNVGSRPEEWAPLTEFKNGANDYLFIGILIAPPNFARSTINTFPGGAPTQPGTGLPPTSTGTSGMIVDNFSASNQASSLYFASLGNNTAVKYTQVGLQ